MKKILTEYDNKLLLYKTFETKMLHLISDLLAEHDINVNSISTRVKDKKSLEKKLLIKNKYTNIHEITDIVGLRIVTYFEDEVDVIADIISKEFEIDIPNSVDKRIIEYDKFGYSSLHYVASLNSSRNNLSEYKACKNLKFEIQIRSILQHAWAEVEHDIGYKSKGQVPDILKRNFSRVAALLETADLEFTKLRIKLTKYEEEVENEISQNPNTVDLNNISLKSFYQNDPIIKEIDSEIINIIGVRLDEEIDNQDIVKLRYVGILNIQQLSKELYQHREDITKFAKIFLDGRKYDNDSYVSAGISLFYLCYVLLLEKNETDIANYVETFWVNDKTNLFERLLETNKKMKGES